VERRDSTTPSLYSASANTVGTGQVINGSVLDQDFKPGQLPRGARGLQAGKED